MASCYLDRWTGRASAMHERGPVSTGDVQINECIKETGL